MPLQEVAQLAPLPGPYEIFEGVQGQPITLVVVGHVQGKAWITPRDGRPRYEIPMLRVTVRRDDKRTGAPYWDITSKHVIATMLGYLEAAPTKTWQFRLVKSGSGASARYAVEAQAL